MTARQAGVSLNEALVAAQGIDAVPLQRLAQGVTYLAYNEPDYADAEAQARTIAEFANQQEINCYNNLASYGQDP